MNAVIALVTDLWVVIHIVLQDAPPPEAVQEAKLEAVQEAKPEAAREAKPEALHEVEAMDVVRTFYYVQGFGLVGSCICILIGTDRGGACPGGRGRGRGRGNGGGGRGDGYGALGDYRVGARDGYRARGGAHFKDAARG